MINRKVKFVIFTIIAIAGIHLLGRVESPDNLAFTGHSPNPFLVLALFTSILLNAAEVGVFSIALSIFYFWTVNFQADFQKIDTIFTAPYLSLGLSILIIPVVIAESVNRFRRKNLEILKKHEEQRIHLETVLTKSLELEEELKELGRKFLGRVSSEASLTESFEKIFSGREEAWAQGVVELFKGYLGSENISIVTSIDGDSAWSYFDENAKKVLPCFEEHPECSSILANHESWPFDFIGGVAFRLKASNQTTGAIVIEDIPFENFVDVKMDELKPVVKLIERSIEIQKKRLALECGQIFYDQGNILTSKSLHVLNPSKALKSSRQTKISIDYRGSSVDGRKTTEDIVKKLWPKKLHQNELLAKGESELEYIYINLDCDSDDEFITYLKEFDREMGGDIGVNMQPILN
ncbi:MAG: hypothetical protein HOE90_10700 [Bacteriovoracaceae bacterium]|jgi:hypothetical protein|nr:hypothetical protein [Bacteriovoracaceae bacterium]